MTDPLRNSQIIYVQESPMPMPLSFTLLIDCFSFSSPNTLNKDGILLFYIPCPWSLIIVYRYYYSDSWTTLRHISICPSGLLYLTAF